ncbi:MAG: hypothetical protein DWI22_06740 [Planctomycetota bacterium]|nr:MAG: hypothetical protein DWI22_06740 [Planctomycetota bacterium]
MGRPFRTRDRFTLSTGTVASGSAGFYRIVSILTKNSMPSTKKTSRNQHLLSILSGFGLRKSYFRGGVMICASFVRNGNNYV